MDESVIETLKELVKANGNQAAVILDAIIEALEQSSGGKIAGEAGQVAVCDGEGGAEGSDKLYVTDAGVRSTVNIRAEGDITATGTVGAGSLSVGGETIAKGNLSVSGDITAKRKVIVDSDIIAHGSLTSGDNKTPGEIFLYSNKGDEWSITVEDDMLKLNKVG